MGNAYSSQVSRRECIDCCPSSIGVCVLNILDETLVGD